MSKQRVVEAVNHLISAANYAVLANEMTRIIETWDTSPMVYGGENACLNAMIDVGLRDRGAFERLLKLVEERRKLLPGVKRVDYQRQLMRERRARETKAMELQEHLHGPIRGAQRMVCLEDLRKRWAEARDKYVASKGDLSWKERNAAVREFWDRVDAALDMNIRDARKVKARA